MFDTILRNRRTRLLAQAINRCDVPVIVELIEKGVNLENFRASYSDPIPHAPESISSIRDPLLWAAMCHVPVAGLAMSALRVGHANSQLELGGNIASVDLTVAAHSLK